MADINKAKEQLIKELDEVHQQIVNQKFIDAEDNQINTVLNKLLQAAQQRRRETEALLDSSRAILTYRKFEDAARSIFDSAKAITGATSGYVALLTDDGMENEVLFLDAGGRACTVDPSLPMPIRGLRSEAYYSLQTVYDNEFPDSEWMKFMPAGHVSLDNVLFAPLILGEKAVGLLGLANKPSEFTEVDARMATAFGELAAIALLNSRTLENLEKSEQHFRSVTQSAGDAIITINEQGNIIFWNNMAEELFGYSVDEVIDQPPTFIIPERFQEAHQINFQNAIVTRNLQHGGERIEMAGHRKDGSEFPFELSLDFWEGGEDIFFSATIRDITERKQVEKELRQLNAELEQRVAERTAELMETNTRLRDSETRMRAIFESSLDAIGVSKAGIHVAANPAYLKMFGYKSVDQLKDKPILDLIAPSEHERITSYVRQRLQGKPVPSSYETRGRRQDGTEFDMETSVSTYTLDDEIYSVVILRDITERKLYESKLSRSAKEYQVITSTTLDGFWILGTDGRLRDVNDAYCQMTGYDHDELLTMSVSDIEAQENPEETKARIQKLIEIGYGRFESRHRCKDGRIIDVEVSTTYFSDSDCFLGFIRNITEKREAAEALRQERNLLGQIAQTSPVGIAVVNQHGQITFANTSAEQILGLSKDEITERTYNAPAWKITDLNGNPFPDEQLPFSQVMASGQPVYDVQHAIEWPDGQRVFLSINAAPLVDSTGEIEGMVAAIEDITERKQAEKALRESESRLQEAQQLARIGSWEWDLTSQELSWSDEVYRLFGHEPNAFEPSVEKLESFIHPDDLEDFVRRRDQMLNEKRSALIDHRIVFPDGGIRYVQERAQLILDAQGEVIRVIGTVQDITESKLLEKEARKAEILQVELEKEKEVVALKDRFMSTVSHEFRTPLAIIQTSSDLLVRYIERMTPERRGQALDQIQEQIANLTKMIDGVLSIGRAQSGRLEFNPVPMKLGPFCQTIFEQIKFADTVEHKFVFNNNAPDQPVLVDIDLLKHILTNLLTNAIKYTPEKGKIIFDLDHDDNNVVIKVSDKGIGIPQEDQVRLFRPFHRASNVGNAEGTGLGLSIVKEYVELHGGDIAFTSEVGKGSTFRVVLPMA